MHGTAGGTHEGGVSRVEVIPDGLTTEVMSKPNMVRQTSWEKSLSTPRACICVVFHKTKVVVSKDREGSLGK